MMHDLKPYSTYRDSGVAWLGAVPAHWELWRNGRLFTKSGGTGFPELPILEVSLKTGLRVRDLKGSNRKQVMAERAKYQCASEGDLVYNTMRMWQGAVGVAPVDGLISPAYVVARPVSGVESRYYEYLFRTDAYMGEVDRCSRGIVSDRNRLYWEQFKQLPSLVPSLEEQTAIVRFLDHADRQIRRYIRAKQKLVKLLEEQKQAIIHRAVSRGLNADVRLKPSGVEWLGEVPEHWEVITLKHIITRMEQGWSPQCDAQQAGEGEWGVMKVGCVNRDHFDSTQNKRLPLSLEPVPSLEIKHGDILVSRANTRDLLGLAALSENPRARLILCDKLFRFRALPDRADSRYLVYAIRGRTSRAQIESSTNGASDSMQNIGQGVIRNLWISLPSLREQQMIVAEIQGRTRMLDTRIAQEEREISLLREYRTRLIADVVTGKLDVRAAAATLPSGELDEGEALEPEDELMDAGGAEEEELPAELEALAG